MAYHLNGTYRLPKDYNPPILTEFVEPNPSDHFIYWLFRYRCIECKQAANEINEILPRARSKNAIMDWSNRVPLCRTCHVKYHDGGVDGKKMEDMKKIRKEFLISIGRGDYV
jgi:5-methylcytosine-specific restriction endonuclease McrA